VPFLGSAELSIGGFSLLTCVTGFLHRISSVGKYLSRDTIVKGDGINAPSGSSTGRFRAGFTQR